MAVPFIDLRRFEPGFLDRWAEKCGEISRETRFVGGRRAGGERQGEERQEMEGAHDGPFGLEGA